LLYIISNWSIYTDSKMMVQLTIVFIEKTRNGG
jgi:hypothetical protein